MRKIFLLIATTTCLPSAFPQLTLNDSDIETLVQIGEYYSGNVMLTKETALEDLEKLRTDRLSSVIDLLQVQARKSNEIFDVKYFYRPDEDILIMWYIIREIHYNLTDEESRPRPSIEVAKETLQRQIDSNWLIDNYYFRLYGSIATIFNDTDLSTFNIDIDNYGLKSNTERAIVFLNLMDALGTRFLVLQMLKKYDKLLEFNSRMPKFNGLDYFYLNDFDYEDFDWIGHKKLESFNQAHIGKLYDILTAHINAEASVNNTLKVQEIYSNSIMSNPDYFKYSKSENDLKKLYNQNKKKR